MSPPLMPKEVSRNSNYTIFINLISSHFWLASKHKGKRYKRGINRINGWIDIDFYAATSPCTTGLSRITCSRIILVCSRSHCYTQSTFSVARNQDVHLTTCQISIASCCIQDHGNARKAGTSFFEEK